MKTHYWKTACIILFLIFNLTSHVKAQQDFYTEYQAQLTDIDESVITCDTCDLVVTLFDQQSGEAVYYMTMIAGTDVSGWLSLELGIQEIKPGMKLQLDFIASENTKWLDPDERFSISYSFKEGEGPTGISIVRSEGTMLEMTNIDGDALYSDPYSFAYIRGGFLFSKTQKPDLSLALRKKINSTYKLPSRSVKSGFAVGGYNKQ